MSALLNGKCVRLSPSRIPCSGMYFREFSQLRCLSSRGSGLLPHLAGVRKLDSRGYITSTTGKHAQRSSSVASSHFINSISPPRPVLAPSLTPLSRTIGKRYQHAHAMEATADVDHAPTIASYPEWIRPQDTLPKRHIGPSDEEVAIMLKSLKQPDLEAFIQQTIPGSIRASKEFKIPSEQTPETEMLDELTKAGKANSAAEVDTYIGMGYHPTITPGVIKRNVLENPGWYTSYTPYQPEISQGTTISLTLLKLRSFGKFIEFPNSDYRTHWPAISECVIVR